MAVTVILICVIWAGQLRLLPVGGLHFYDEFHTLDRASGFLRHDDWFVVHSMQEQNFRKPPLQYWITAGLLDSGLNELVALRLPSVVFSLGCLVAVALLAFAVMPSNPWAIPAALMLFASSGMYWEHALSAMLDSGAVFFATLALAAAILAREQPFWWYVAAVSIALGALVKAPVGLATVGMFLLLQPLDRRPDRLRLRVLWRDRHFRAAVAIALVGAIAWPVFQSLAYDRDAFQELIGKQMLQRFTPTDRPEEIRTSGDLYHLLIANEPLLRFACIAALIWLPFRLQRPELRALPAMLALYAIALLLAGGHVTARYSLYFLPLMTVALACVVVSLAPRGWPGLLAATALSLAAGGFVKSERQLDIATGESAAAQIEPLTRLGESLRPEETLVVCTTSRPERIIPALASHLAANGRPFVRLDGDAEDLREQIEKMSGETALRGICPRADLREFRDMLDGFEILQDFPHQVLWTARGVGQATGG